MEEEPWLRRIASLPDCSFTHRHEAPKVTEKPKLYIVASEEGIEDNVVFLPKFPEPPDEAA